jgi:hypothetical protein
LKKRRPDMALNRPEGYFYAQHDDGKFVIEENGPGLGAVRVSWKPSGNFDADRKHEFRMPLEVWQAVVNQKLHEMAQQKARLADVPAKVKAAKVS